MVEYKKGHNKELIGEYVHIHSIYREEEKSNYLKEISFIKILDISTFFILI